jgi:Tfp pilus assembly protein PilF
MKRQWILECALLVSLSLLVILIAGCSTTSKPGEPPTSAPLIERPSAGAAALREGTAAFERGEYGRAESKLAESFKLGLSNTPDLLRGLKTQAFVYCVTARTAQCEKSFDAAFNVDKKFNLTPTERQQPVWGPVFAKVQKRYL